MKPTIFVALALLAAVPVCAAADSSFRVKVPDLNGRQASAVLTFDDQDKLLEIRSPRLTPVTIPYADIDQASYQYTKEHTVALTKEKIHWLEIDYHVKDARKVLVLHMGARDHIKILDALKAHTGIDAEVLGNADKRH